MPNGHGRLTVGGGRLATGPRPRSPERSTSARGGIRTHTRRSAGAFKAPLSACSITRAGGLSLGVHSVSADALALGGPLVRTGTAALRRHDGKARTRHLDVPRRLRGGAEPAGRPAA